MACHETQNFLCRIMSITYLNYLEFNIIAINYSIYFELLECFKKNLCPKLGGWFSNWPNKESFF